MAGYISWTLTEGRQEAFFYTQTLCSLEFISSPGVRNYRELTKKMLCRVNKGHLSLSLGGRGDEGTVLCCILIPLQSSDHSLDKHSIRPGK